MPPSEAPTAARELAARVSGDEKFLMGPLKGYHHETYVFPLPNEPGAIGSGRWKCREPRKDLLYFDRRCFRSEEELLRALDGRVSRIPEIIDVGECGLQRFIEGSTLGSRHTFDDVIPRHLLAQIAELFGELGRVDHRELKAERDCAAKDRPADGDTAGFLERLICFTEERVYLGNARRFGGLFHSLGIRPDCFGKLRERVAGMSSRPFSLLHGDLHRENFIVDPEGRLWTIDWELAMIGDPLYDLATHLYLMRYRPDQEADVIRSWRHAVDDARPGSSDNWQDDLPRLLDYKRAQSAFTDAIRASLTLDLRQGFADRSLFRAAEKIRTVLAAAGPALGMTSVPARARIVEALRKWAHADESRRVPMRRGRKSGAVGAAASGVSGTLGRSA